MGNTESNVTSGVKKQTDTSSILLYKLVDLKGEEYSLKCPRCLKPEIQPKQ